MFGKTVKNLFRSKEAKMIRDYFERIGCSDLNEDLSDEEVVESLIASHMRIRDVETQLTNFRQKINNYRGTITKKWLWENMP